MGIDVATQPIEHAGVRRHQQQIGADPVGAVLLVAEIAHENGQIDKIMMTSMETANTLATERMGRWSRLAKMSLFMFELENEELTAASRSLLIKGNKAEL